ncbi:hypothetical protein PIB30_060351 [Stylosanthes scabra]|uniref:DUF4218 domain-containing protein n=1 Tax=Stylosanthes scabra TaxID=79078 RepID=A0ABU6QK62_9FABA|nr:hypothetical protein [Stylosanthes scabra]
MMLISCYMLQVPIKCILLDHVVVVLVRLSSFFRRICQKAISMEEVACLEAEIAETLSRPKGSIIEGYLANECINFCSRYLHEDVQTRFNRVPRNNDERFSNEQKLILPIESKKWVMQGLCRAWKKYKGDVKLNHFMKYKTRKRMLKNRPIEIPERGFKENNEEPSRAEIFTVTRTSKKGKGIDPKSQSTIARQNHEEAFVQVLRKDQPVRLRYGASVTRSSLKKHEEIRQVRGEHNDRVSSLQRQMEGVCGLLMVMLQQINPRKSEEDIAALVQAARNSPLDASSRPRNTPHSSESTHFPPNDDGSGKVWELTNDQHVELLIDKGYNGNLVMFKDQNTRRLTLCRFWTSRRSRVHIKRKCIDLGRKEHGFHEVTWSASNLKQSAKLNGFSEIEAKAEEYVIGGITTTMVVVIESVIPEGNKVITAPFSATRTERQQQGFGSGRTKQLQRRQG